jgi:hypothetical protein
MRCFVKGFFDWSFLSFVSATLFPEAEGELEVRPFCLGEILDADFLLGKEIIQPVSNGIVEEGGHAEEAF